MPPLRPLSTPSPKPLRPAAPDVAPLTAKLEQVHAGVGLSKGALTLNGRTYRFNSGQTDRAALPVGEYMLRRGTLPASASEFTSQGVAFVYFLDGKNQDGSAVAPRSGNAWDPRLGRLRTELRLRPDIGAPGTAGAMGVVGTKQELQRLKDDLDAALRRSGGALRLVVR